MRLSVVINVIGRMLRLFGIVFAVPAAVCWFYGERWDAGGLVVGGGVSVILGQLMILWSDEAGEDLRRIEALAVVAGTWLVVAHLGAVPYLWAGLPFIDALFESMSGFTTTGATILAHFDRLGRGMLFWRSMTQWIGGLGVITLFVAVFPRLAIDVRQLFLTETEAGAVLGEKLTPQIRKTVTYLWRLYAGLTLAALIALLIAGMPFYDAVCHAMTTLSAGGFSPHPESIMGYGNAAVEWVICVFMFLAGANFALQYLALLGRPSLLFRDEEFRAYTAIAVLATACLGLVLWRVSGDATAFRHSTFQTLSILTTTGYASIDWVLWTDQAKVVLLALMFVGGCAGSAAGGPKVLRHVLVGRYTLLELRRTLHPRGVLPVKLGGKVVPEEVMRTALVFFLFYILMFAICAALVIGLGADIVTGLTATIGTLGNIGPGLAGVGPMANYGHLHPLSKIVLTAAMWIGRLEVLAVLALLRPEVWRGSHWRALQQ